MDYTQITDRQHEEMLSAIGIDHVDRLFDIIPESIRCKGELDLSPPLSELELQRSLTEMASHNIGAHNMACFMGCGAYDHFYPVLIDQLISRGEFLTSYTPYQAEASQGTLQAFFEFQTQISRLAGTRYSQREFVRRSVRLVAEAAILAVNTTRRHTILVASTIHPEYLAVLAYMCFRFTRAVESA